MKPVFIVGSPRSGTTWLYHLLLSSGGFAIYRSESQVFNRFGAMLNRRGSQEKRDRFLDSWLRSEFFLRSGLDANVFRQTVADTITSPGDFLRILMEQICAQQGASRWADCTPEHGLYIAQIKRDFPDALFIHIVRDGRDVALSLAKKNFIQPLPWGSFPTETAAAIYWAWITRRIVDAGRRIDGDILTVRYEDLVESLQETLQRIAAFVEKPIDMELIEDCPIGSVSEPNSSFGEQGRKFDVGVARWRSRCSPKLLETLDKFIGPELAAFGYQVPEQTPQQQWSVQLQRLTHKLGFEARHFLKRCGFSRRVDPENWDATAGTRQLQDPTLRPGSNLAIVRGLVRKPKLKNGR